MSPRSPEETSETATVESITDPESLRSRDDVPFHDDSDVVETETVDLLEELDDMAVVGVTNGDGDVLLRKLTADCDWKLPLVSVPPGEDHTAAARRAVEEVVGLEVVLESLEGVWYYEARTEDDARVASRCFVVFSASPVTDATSVDELAADGPHDDRPAAVGWFDELPADAGDVPGTRLFVD